MRKSLLVLVLIMPLDTWAEGIAVKVSISVPASTSNDPTFNVFDASQFNGYSTQEPFGKPWGIHMTFYDRSGLGLDVAWIKNRSSHMVVQSNTASDQQITEHWIDPRTFRLGIRYDLFHSNNYFSLEPGLGGEISTAQHTFTSTHTRGATVLKKKGRDWNLNFDPGIYFSLAGQVYPLRKERHLGIGLTTRYVRTPPTWAFKGTSLLGSYFLPISHRKWSTSADIIFAF